MNLLSYDACPTIIHALISCRLDYCNSMYNVSMSKTDRLQKLQNQCVRILTNSHVGNILPQVFFNHCLKILHRIIYTILMLPYKSYYNIAPSYLCELINRKKVMGILAWELIIISLIYRQLVRIVLTLLERSFIYAAPCEWNKLSEHIRTLNFDCFKKSVKLMLFTQQFRC